MGCACRFCDSYCLGNHGSNLRARQYKRARISAIEAKRERNQALASVSREQTDKGFAKLGILLALEALPKENDGNQLSAAAAEPALLRALFKQRERYILQDHTDSVNKIRFSPTGSLAATASRDGTVRFSGHVHRKARWRIKGPRG